LHAALDEERQRPDRRESLLGRDHGAPVRQLVSSEGASGKVRVRKPVGGRRAELLDLGTQRAGNHVWRLRKRWNWKGTKDGVTLANHTVHLFQTVRAANFFMAFSYRC